MQNTTKNNIIYLSGGGNENQSLPLDKFFFNELPKGGHFLYIPIALRDDDLYPTATTWMNKLLTLHARTDVKFDVVDDLLEYQNDNIKSFDAIYIGGGNTWSLMKEMKDADFASQMIQYHKNGGLIYGGSAGAIILGKKINTHDDENKINLKDTSGLNILSNYSIACHYNNEQQDRFNLWATQSGNPIICLPEETGLIIKNDSALCVGTKPCTVHYTNGKISVVSPKELLDL